MRCRSDKHTLQTCGSRVMSRLLSLVQVCHVLSFGFFVQSSIQRLCSLYLFDRELRSGLSMSFNLIHLRGDFVKFLYEIRKFYMRNMSHICLTNVPNFCLMSHVSAQCPQFLPNVLNICQMSHMSAQCRALSNLGFLVICSNR